MEGSQPRGEGSRRARAVMMAAGACWVALCACPVQADAVPEECDIQVDPRLSVYVVTVGQDAFQDKRYLTWDDALRLRDVLVSAGACERAAPPKPCKLERNGSDSYAVVRDGVNFDPRMKLGTLDEARRYARQLEKEKLCKPLR